MRHSLRRFALVLGLACAGTVHAQAALVPISNPSFEAPPIPAATFFTDAPPVDWQVYGIGINFILRRVGVVHPAGLMLYDEPVPDGQNAAVVFLLDVFEQQHLFAGVEAGLEQQLTTPLATNTRYVLQVHVGNIDNDPTPPCNQFQFTGFPGYRIELLAGGTPLASDLGTLLPDEGHFLLSTIEFRTGASHALAGQPLGIRLINLNAAPGIEVNFDDVRLTAEPIATPALAASTQQLSLFAGGTQALALDAGASNPFGLFLMLTTTTGTSPGTPLAPTPHVLPLNFSNLFLFTLLTPNQLIPGSLGFLDASGRANLNLTLPPGLDSSLAGATVHHAYMLLDIATLQATFVSEAVPLGWTQ